MGEVEGVLLFQTVVRELFVGPKISIAIQLTVLITKEVTLSYNFNGQGGFVKKN
jgi:hypothetical protein